MPPPAKTSSTSFIITSTQVVRPRLVAFATKVEAAFRRLVEMPHMGNRYEHDHPALAELRVLPLSSPFKNFLVFYRPMANGIEIARVLHGARDVSGILSDEFGIGEDLGDEEAKNGVH